MIEEKLIRAYRDDLLAIMADPKADDGSPAAAVSREILCMVARVASWVLGEAVDYDAVVEYTAAERRRRR